MCHRWGRKGKWCFQKGLQLPLHHLSAVSQCCLFFLGAKHTGNPCSCTPPASCSTQLSLLPAPGANNPLSKSMKKTQITCQSVLSVTFSAAHREIYCDHTCHCPGGQSWCKPKGPGFCLLKIRPVPSVYLKTERHKQLQTLQRFHCPTLQQTPKLFCVDNRRFSLSWLGFACLTYFFNTFPKGSTKPFWVAHATFDHI